jgi:hypothetical protein
VIFFDRRYLAIFLVGLQALIIVGSSASISLPNGNSMAIEGSDSVDGITTQDGTEITATGSIHAAINAAVPGAKISLLPKTYYEIVQVPIPLSIKGAGRDLTKVDGSGKIGSIFTIGSKENPNIDVTLSDMTIQNGNAPKGAGILNLGRLEVVDCAINGNTASDSDARGGGIYNNGIITINDCFISGNKASGSEAMAAAPHAKGGGIYNNGTATIFDSIISGNGASASSLRAADAYGGGIYNNGIASITITGCIVSENKASAGAPPSADARGGGISNYGTATIIGSTISGNTASGGVLHRPIIAYGGGIYSNGTTVITGSIISNNNANGGGGISWTNLRPAIDLATVITNNNEPQIYPY